jgi:NAD(P)H-nitrite reductase large subunit
MHCKNKGVIFEAVKVTGGQRIDLLGIPKENLNDMWDEIAAAGMESGYAYGKATRTCKSFIKCDQTASSIFTDKPIESCVPIIQ